MLFVSPKAEFHSAQWIGPTQLLVEIKALQAAGLHMRFSVVPWSESPAAASRAVPREVFLPDHQKQVGEPKTLSGDTICRMIPPPAR
jgi:hypothetical protein